MDHRHFVRTIAALTLAFAAFLYCAATSDARPVALSDATYAPTTLVLLHAGDAVTVADRFGYDCHTRNGRGYFSDVSAYKWNGRALGAQRWDSVDMVYYWRIPHTRGQSVRFDGATFYNDSRHSVLVAGWCE